MKGRICSAVGASAAVVVAALAFAGSDASGVTKSSTATARVALGAPTVRKVDRMLRGMDRRRVERYDRKLASFGTRHTLSSQDDPHRGIGAARDWITARFKLFAASSGGRMT